MCHCQCDWGDDSTSLMLVMDKWNGQDYICMYRSRPFFFMKRQIFWFYDHEKKQKAIRIY